MTLPHDPTSPAAAWEEWEASLADDDRSPATVDHYRKGLGWVPRELWVGPWADLTRPALMAALRAADRKPNGDRWSPSTRTRNRKCWAALQKFAVRLKFGAAVIDEEDLRGSGYGSREAIYSADQWAKLLAAAGSDAVVLALESLGLSGMRPSELCRATIADVRRRGEGTAIVLAKHKTAAKTGKPRVIPVGVNLCQLIAEAMGERTGGPVWLDPRGEAWTPASLARAFRRARSSAGLPAELKLYSTRHTFGTAAVKSIGEIGAAAILGHTTLTMTKRYTHLATGDLAAAMDAIG